MALDGDSFQTSTRPVWDSASRGSLSERMPFETHHVGRVASAPLRSWWLDVDVDGAEFVPEFGGAIIAANHLSFIDSLLLMYSLGRPVRFLGKAEYMDSVLTRTLFPAVGMIPIDRSGSGLAGTLRVARRCLEDGHLLGIFPEGTRSRDGQLLPGHSGVAHLALATGCPIVPVGLRGTDRAMPVGSRRIHRESISIGVGPLIGPGPISGKRPTRRDRHDLTDRVMAAIAQLSGNEDPMPVEVDSSERLVAG